MSVAYTILMWEAIDLTPDQATRLLKSGVPLFDNERKYLKLRAEGVPFRRMRFPKYMADRMADLRARASMKTEESVPI
jgi:hypothetical protein